MKIFTLALTHTLDRIETIVEIEAETLEEAKGIVFEDDEGSDAYVSVVEVD